MSIFLAAAVVAAALNTLSYLPYIRDVINGRAQPHVVTWFIWSALTVMVIASSEQLGASAALLLPAAQLVGCGVVCVLAVRHTAWSVTRWDALALVVAGLGGLGWWLTDSAMVGLVASIVAFGTGSALTAVKAWREPSSETATVWLMGVGAGVFAVVAALGSSSTAVIYPVYITVANLVIATPVVLHARRTAQDGPLSDYEEGKSPLRS